MYSRFGYPTIWIIGTFSANAAAWPLIAFNSPEQNDVTNAPMPLTLAYALAAFAAHSSVEVYLYF